MITSAKGKEVYILTLHNKYDGPDWLGVFERENGLGGVREAFIDWVTGLQDVDDGDKRDWIHLLSLWNGRCDWECATYDCWIRANINLTWCVP